MDKYEFNIKVEQIKKLVNRGDYATAMKIADTIDWHRVRTASLLSMVAQVYEKNEEYQAAKDILLLAYERAPIGKRLLYKLGDLALKEGNVTEAEAYYREFCELAPEDPRQYLLRYLILKAKNAPVDQLIRSLEEYASLEVDEKWLYELAELYHEAGNGAACVAACDKIMLLFGLGKYVDKAMDLKLQYEPLSKYQMDLVENRDKYEAKLRAVEEEYSTGTVYHEDYDENQAAEAQSAAPALDAEKEAVMKIHEDAQSEQLAREMSRITADGGANDIEDAADATRRLDDLRVLKDLRASGMTADASAEKTAGEELMTAQTAGTAETAADAAAGAYVSEEESAEDAARRAEAEREIERQRSAIRAAKEREEMEEEALRRAEEEREEARRAEEERRAKKQAEIDRERALNGHVRNIAQTAEDPELEIETLNIDTNHLMIEADSDEAGLSIALDALKKIHRELGYKNPVAKISSEKLNRRGISQIAGKLSGKDLVIEHAADLTNALQNELDELMERDKSGMIVVLIDTRERLEALHAANLSLAEKFQYIAADEHAEERKKTEADVEAALKKETETQERISREVVPAETVSAADAGEDAPVRENMAVPEGEPERENRVARKEAEESREESDYPEEADDEDDDSRRRAYESDGYEEEPEEYEEEEPKQEKRGLFGFGKKKKKKEQYEDEYEEEYDEEVEESGATEENEPSAKQASRTAGGQAVKTESGPASGKTRTAASDSTEEVVPEDYDDGKEMDPDEFAQYACKYAASIDCSITGKSLLALYERIEMMDEDEEPLTKRAAVQLIEDAANKAENPGFAKKLTGIFSAKYSKDGLLILHENDFFD